MSTDGRAPERGFTFTDQHGEEHFFDFASCTEIDFRWAQTNLGLTDGVVQQLSANLGRFNALRKIVLVSNEFSDETGLAIAEGLKSNSSVKVVNLYHSGISRAVARQITQVLLTRYGADQGIAIAGSFFDFATTDKVSVEGEDLEPDEVQALCANLHRFQCLETLDLDLGGISEPANREINKFILERHVEDSGVAIAFKFFDFETCEAIDLCWKKLKDDDIQPLGANLGRFKRLKEIKMRSNKFTDVGVCAIAEGLKNNTSVTKIDLNGNTFSIAAVCRMISCMLHNDSLSRVHIPHHPLSCVGHIAWQHEELCIPPDEVVIPGWAGVLSFLRRIFKHRCHKFSLVLNAAAVCSIFSRSLVKVHGLLPSARVGMNPSLRLVELASLQRWCPDNLHKERLMLLCCSCPLSTLASRLACADHTGQGNQLMFEQIIKRIFSIAKVHSSSSASREKQ